MAVVAGAHNVHVGCGGGDGNSCEGDGCCGGGGGYGGEGRVVGV